MAVVQARTAPSSRDYYAALRGEAVKYARPFHHEYTGQAKASLFPYITYYSLGKDKSLRETTYSRSEFLVLANRAIQVLLSHKIGKGSRICHYFSANRIEDLAFRYASAMIGSVPVTVNWSADTAERVSYKVSVTGSVLMLVDFGAQQSILDAANIPVVNAVHTLAGTPQEKIAAFAPVKISADDDRIVIFTSGTTGHPKGVMLSYANYEANKTTFQQFLSLEDEDNVVFCPVIINPLHHTNSTSFTDWALRRSNVQIHLFERYTTAYWSVIARLGKSSEGGQQMKVIAPVVSRHFDFLENLVRTKQIEEAVLKPGLSAVHFLVGSAPVGPSTVKRIQRFADHLPLVRFGSTETCLQVVGTVLSLTEKERLAAFKRGWEHKWNGEKTAGYYIGQEHPGNTELTVVHSVDREKRNFLVECKPGEPGYLITRGGHVMRGYIRNEEATKCALYWEEGQVHPWYLNLGDVGFWLQAANGKKDHYWVSRDNAILIRGGSNYAYAQINADLSAFIVRMYPGADPCHFTIAVVGLKLQSEHEDECLVTIEIQPKMPAQVRAMIEERFVCDAREISNGLYKGAWPSQVRFATIPRNFKGAILVKELQDAWTIENNRSKKGKVHR